MVRPVPRVSLIFPPFCESALHGPHLAIPLLRGVLESQGVSTKGIDLNIRTVRHLVSPRFLAVLPTATATSSLPAPEKQRTHEAIEHLREVGLPTFLNSGTNQLRLFLKLAKAVLFPHHRDLAHCLSHETRRHETSSMLYDQYVRAICREQPDVVAITIAFSDQLSEAIELARRVKRVAGDVEVWTGGSQLNLLDHQQIDACARSGHFDRISLGNGEQSILMMVEDYCRDTTNPVLYESETMSVADINATPSPLFDEVDDYFKPISLPVLATKGCYWGQCTFCDYPRLSALGAKRCIAREPGLALSDIRLIRERFGNVRINLISDAIPPVWYRQLCTLAFAGGVRLNSWSYMMHSKSLTPELLKLMSKAGVLSINFGTESTVDRILDVMKKQVGYSVIKRNLEDAKAAGIRVVANVIPDYPTTTSSEAFLNAHRFETLLPLISSINPQMFDLTAGTPIDDDPNAYGLEVPSNAYIKTNHGYHSRPFHRDRDLTSSDRRIIQRAFSRLKVRKQIARRKDQLPTERGDPTTRLVLDGSAALVGERTPEVWMMSMGTRWRVSDNEARALRRVFSTRSRVVNIGYLTKIANDVVGSKQAERWIDSLAEAGIILGDYDRLRLHTEEADGRH